MMSTDITVYYIGVRFNSWHSVDEGYFELVKPPNPDDEMRVDGLEDAIAESVEDYMEKNEDKKWFGIEIVNHINKCRMRRGQWPTTN